MTAVWTIAEAKEKFSEVVKRSKDFPQVITKHGHECAVISNPKGYPLTRKPSALISLLAKIDSLKAKHGDDEITLSIPARAVEEMRDPFE